MIVTDLNEKITQDEQQRQFLYIAVNKQRRERADLRRKALQANSVKQALPSKDRSHLKRGRK